MLKELAATGKHGLAWTAPGAVRRAINPDAKTYAITRFGRKALAEAMS